MPFFPYSSYGDRELVSILDSLPSTSDLTVLLVPTRLNSIVSMSTSEAAMPDDSPWVMRSSEHDHPYEELALPLWTSTARLVRVGEYVKAGNATSSFPIMVHCLALLEDRRRCQLGPERL